MYNILYYIYYYICFPGVNKSGNIVYDRKTWSICHFKAPSRVFRPWQDNYTQTAAKRRHGNLERLFGYDFRLYSLFILTFGFRMF